MNYGTIDYKEENDSCLQEEETQKQLANWALCQAVLTSFYGR